ATGYPARIRDAIRPNLLAPRPVPRGIVAEVEVRVAPDGRITRTRLVHASGSAEWDHDVLLGLARTRRLPLDGDGRIPPVLLLSFRPERP
ncbi:MAG TPA: energy transducer TonB, partial [Burkholderiaceae bacterium]